MEWNTKALVLNNTEKNDFINYITEYVYVFAKYIYQKNGFVMQTPTTLINSLFKESSNYNWTKNETYDISNVTFFHYVENLLKTDVIFVSSVYDEFKSYIKFQDKYFKHYVDENLRDSMFGEYDDSEIIKAPFYEKNVDVLLKTAKTKKFIKADKNKYKQSSIRYVDSHHQNQSVNENNIFYEYIKAYRNMCCFMACREYIDGKIYWDNFNEFGNIKCICKEKKIGLLTSEYGLYPLINTNKLNYALKNNLYEKIFICLFMPDGSIRIFGTVCNDDIKDEKNFSKECALTHSDKLTAFIGFNKCKPIV